MWMGWVESERTGTLLLLEKRQPYFVLRWCKNHGMSFFFFPIFLSLNFLNCFTSF